MFVPGDSERFLTSARRSAADALILDLEDAVGEEKKAEARALTANFLADDRAPKSHYVRINALDTAHWLSDLMTVAPQRPDGIVLPKCTGPEDLARLSWVLDGLEAANDLAPGRIRIIGIVTETAASLLGAPRYLGLECPRLAGLMWGGEDLSADVGASSPRGSSGSYLPVSDLARSLCLLISSSLGVPAIDAVYVGLDDPVALREEAELAAAMGFGAKAAIHPTHLDVINTAFTPSDVEVEEARRVVAAFADGASGAVRLDGKMLDGPHLKAAQRTLGRHLPSSAPAD
jgi:citrate lyase subunit beta/citryl-CoA lyase